MATLSVVCLHCDTVAIVAHYRAPSLFASPDESVGEIDN